MLVYEVDEDTQHYTINKLVYLFPELSNVIADNSKLCTALRMKPCSIGSFL